MNIFISLSLTLINGQRQCQNRNALFIYLYINLIMMKYPVSYDARCVEICGNG